MDSIIGILQEFPKFSEKNNSLSMDPFTGINLNSSNKTFKKFYGSFLRMEFNCLKTIAPLLNLTQRLPKST